MWKQMDWQMVAFVAVTLFNEYWVNVRIPQIYYYDLEKEDMKAA
ncbi:MAG TPA: hypothetical protein VFK33_11470 [Bacillales bacterium]|nr:hypothetical protein [Bacillales bacterium]